MLKIIFGIVVGLILLELLLRLFFPKRSVVADEMTELDAIAAPIIEEPAKPLDPEIEIRLERARDKARSEGRSADAEEYAGALTTIANHRKAARNEGRPEPDGLLAEEAIRQWFTRLRYSQVGYDRGGQDSKVDEIEHIFDLVEPVVWPKLQSE